METSQRRNDHTFIAVVFRAVHAQLERVDADVVINFEASMQVVQGEAGVKHRAPLGRAVGQERLFLATRDESTEVNLSKQHRPGENRH